MKKKIAIVGRSAVGKNHILNMLSTMGLDVAIGYTSRPIRQNEKNGHDHNFIDQSIFDKMRSRGEFLQCMDFGGYSYGTTIEEFNSCDVFITSPYGLELIPQEYRQKIIIVELVCDQSILDIRVKLSRPFTKPSDIEKRRENDDNLFQGFDEKVKELGYEHVKINTENVLETYFHKTLLSLL